MNHIPRSLLAKATAVLASMLLVAAACSSGSDSSGGVRFLGDDGLVLQGRLFGRGANGVILAHMLNSNQGEWASFADNLANRGFTVLTFDFRGHGSSPGQKQVGIADADLAAALRFMRDNVMQRNIFLIGASMGGTAALKVASREVVLGVITLSAPESIRGLAATLDELQRITAPKLFIAAEGDGAHAANAQRFFDLSKEPRKLQIVPGSDHGVALLQGEQADRVRGAILSFLDANKK